MSGKQAESTNAGTVFSGVSKHVPDHQLKPGADLQYSIGVRSVETFRMERGVSA